MTERRYCYCCRTEHPVEQMVLYPTKAGKRWRCLRSIAAAQSNAQSRDSFGRQQSQENKALSSRAAQNSLFLRHSSQAFA